MTEEIVKVLSDASGLLPATIEWSYKWVIKSVERYATNQLSEKERRITELETALTEMLRCTPVFKENLLSAEVTLAEHCNAVEAAKKVMEASRPVQNYSGMPTGHCTKPLTGDPTKGMFEIGSQTAAPPTEIKIIDNC